MHIRCTQHLEAECNYSIVSSPVKLLHLQDKRHDSLRDGKCVRYFFVQPVSRYTSLLLALPLPLPSIRIPASSPTTAPQHLPLPHVRRNNILHAPHIMLRLPHVIQPRPPRPLNPPLHNLNAFHIRTIYLIPHLHANPRQLIPQQDGRVDALPPNVDAHPCEGISRFLPHEQDIADFGSFGVGFGEELGAGAGGVEDGELVCLEEGCDGGFAELLR
jgi:hypothetical protein